MSAVLSLPVVPIKPSPTYFVRCGDPRRDHGTAIAVWHQSGMGDPDPALARARFQWFYLDNPQGVARITFLLASTAEEPVGFLAIAPRVFRQGAKEWLGGVLVDFSVVPQYRSVLPALTLQREARALALEAIDFVYGLPAPSAAALCSRLPTRTKHSLPRYARVLRSRSYLERHLPAWIAGPLGQASDALDQAAMAARLMLSGLRGSWVEKFDERFDALWSRVATRGAMIGLRDRSFLEWRFREQPAHQYRTFELTEKREQNRLLAYFVCERVGEVLVIKDCLADASLMQLTNGLLLLSRETWRTGCRALSVEIAGDECFRRALAKAHFSLRSERTFFATTKDAQHHSDLPPEFYLTQADEDI